MNTKEEKYLGIKGVGLLFITMIPTLNKDLIVTAHHIDLLFFSLPIYVFFRVIIESLAGVNLDKMPSGLNRYIAVLCCVFVYFALGFINSTEISPIAEKMGGDRGGFLAPYYSAFMMVLISYSAYRECKKAKKPN